MPTPRIKWGTLDVGPDGELYVVGTGWSGLGHFVARSTNARFESQTSSFDFVSAIAGRGADRITDHDGSPLPERDRGG